MDHNENFDTEYITKETALPCFVKPNSSGSSCGMSKVYTAKELAPAIEKAMTDDDEVIIEQFIEGREFTCGVFKTLEKELIFSVTEIISKKRFF